MNNMKRVCKSWRSRWPLSARADIDLAAWATAQMVWPQNAGNLDFGDTAQWIFGWALGLRQQAAAKLHALWHGAARKPHRRHFSCRRDRSCRCAGRCGQGVIGRSSRYGKTVRVRDDRHNRKPWQRVMPIQKPLQELAPKAVCQP